MNIPYLFICQYCEAQNVQYKDDLDGPARTMMRFIKIETTGDYPEIMKVAGQVWGYALTCGHCHKIIHIK